LENPSPHHDKFFKNYWIHPFIHVCVVINYAFFFKNKKIKSMIQKYSLHVPLQEKNPLLCKSFFFLNKNKTPKLLIPSNIKLNNDIYSVNKLNELEELLVSTCLTFVQI